MAWSTTQRIGIAVYLIGMGGYGFGRGFHNLWDTTWGQEDLLTTDRVLNGLQSAGWHVNPCFAVPTIVHMVRRAEKRWRGLQLTKDDYRW
jgi:hypothetical protein